MDLRSRADLVATDVLAYVDGAPAVDLALIDPPYQFDDWDRLLASVDAETIVVESNRVIEMPQQWSTVREKQYGGTVVLIARRVPGQALG